MKQLNYIILPLLILLGCNSPQSQQDQTEAAAEPPNIILILVDDMGFSDLGCYGSEIATPNLDQLASQGKRFTQFHNTSKCFPTRASLLTGLYAHQVGMDRRHGPILNGVTLGQVLKSAGYRTLMSGKHHGTENMYFKGFDRYYGLRDGACNHFNPGEQRPGEPVPAHKTGPFPRSWCIDSATIAPYTPPKDFYTTDYFTKYALDYLETYKDEEQPFFLYLSYTAPHDPLMAWPEDIAKYEGKYDQGYEAIRQKRYQKQVEMGLIDPDLYPLSEETFTDWEQLSAQQKQEEIRKMEVYAAMIDRLDQNIGKVLDKLKETGHYDNTIIFFASDNGASAEVVGTRGLNEGAKEGEIGTLATWSSLGGDWANVSNTPFRFFKNYTHEGGTNTPLIVWWPGQVEPGFSEFAGHVIDFMPTLVELGQASYPQTFQGQAVPEMPGESLLPVIKGQKSQREKPIFWEWGQGKGVWVDGWKLVSDQNQAWELYDMRKDKTETSDLSAEFPEKVKMMEQMWQEWKNDMVTYKQET